MRGGPLALVLLLAACGHTQTVVSGLQPGVDVAKAALRGGSPQTALSLAGGVLAQDPTNEAALVVQGDALTELNRFTEAGDSYNRALQTNPASVGAEVGLGRLRLGSDPAAASVLFLRALDHDPRDTAALNDLGVARDLLGDHAGAQQAYRKALGIDPEDSAAQVNLALSMAMSGAADDAVRMLRPLASNPGASRKLQHDLAAALTMAGDREEAERILSKDLSPEDVQRALTDYAAARAGGGAVRMSAGTQGSEAAVGLTPAPAAAVQPTVVASSDAATSGTARGAIASATLPPPAVQSAPQVATAATAPPPSVATPASVTPPTPAPTPTLPMVAVSSATPVSAAIPPPAAATVPDAAPTTATTPANPQAAASPAPSAPPTTQVQTAASASPATMHVQLGTLHSEADARAEWRLLRKRMPTLLANRRAVFIKMERSGRVLWEIHTGGFTDTAHAKAFCQQVQAAGGGCMVGGA